MTHKNLFCSLLLATVFLVGCTTAQKAALSVSIEKVRQAKDTEAEILKVGLCAMSIGAYHRVNNDTERRSIDVLCGGEWERPVTADDVRALRELTDLMRVVR